MKKYILIFCLIAGVSFYFFDSKEDNTDISHQDTVELDTPQAEAVENRNIVQEKLDEEPYFANGTQTQSYTSTKNNINKDKLKFVIEKKYDHTISNTDIQNIMKFSSSLDEFYNQIDSLAKDLKSSATTNNELIDLSNLPESNDDKNIWFEGFSTVLQQKLFAEINKGKRDHKKIVTHLLAVQAVNFLSAMNFGGYTEDGAFIYEISDNLLANNLVRSKKRKIASQKNAGLFNFTSRLRGTDPGTEQALIDLKSQQTLYGDDLSGHKGRDSIAVQDDPRTTKFFELMESNLFSKLGNFGVSVTTSDYHEQNMELVHSLPKLAKDDPETFGLKKGDNTSIDITDVGFNQLLHMIIHEKSMWSAGISGALSAIIDKDILTFMFTKAPIVFAKFKLILTLGVEPVIMSFLVYQGMKQSYVLHRFYSYMMGSKQASAINRTEFDYYKAVSNFDPGKVYFDEYFRRETITALTKSYTTGVLIRNFLTVSFMRNIANYSLNLNVIQTLIGKYKITKAGRFIEKS